MAGQDSLELNKARENVDKAIREFVRVQAHERGQEDIYVVAWVGFAEYVSRDMVVDEKSAISAIIPDDQNAATSRGLFEFGTDAFSRIS